MTCVCVDPIHAGERTLRCGIFFKTPCVYWIETPDEMSHLGLVSHIHLGKSPQNMPGKEISLKKNPPQKPGRWLANVLSVAFKAGSDLFTVSWAGLYQRHPVLDRDIVTSLMSSRNDSVDERLKLSLLIPVFLQRVSQMMCSEVCIFQKWSRSVLLMRNVIQTVR